MLVEMEYCLVCHQWECELSEHRERIRFKVQRETGRVLRKIGLPRPMVVT